MEMRTIALWTDLVSFYFFSVGLSAVFFGVIASEKEVHGAQLVNDVHTDLTDALFLPCHFNLALTI